jgi:hypothetical protein
MEVTNDPGRLPARRVRWLMPRRAVAPWLAAALAVLAVSAQPAAAASWTWRGSGTLGASARCASPGQRSGQLVCLFHVIDAPRPAGLETGVVEVTNDTPRRACYGVSIASDYMAGLQDFCVKSHARGRYVTRGPARHYRGTTLSIFVTSGSKTQPIQPERGASASPFVVTFSEAAT